jgi:LuxR family maltose regulon positive regulatory protein
VAWVSLEQDDDEASSFWTYVVAALQSALPDLGRSILPLLQSGQQPTRALLATLINEIGDQAADIDLVLDDYHRADAPEVAEGMTYLLDHLPANLHVVVITRADPGLPLARLRARGELAEVRARDLRFTTAEAAEYLAEVSGLAVDLADVTTLADRTEGWAAALQLAALSMRGRDDVAGFVAGFAGDDRYVVDYLADEVLSRQPDHVREFLLRTCVLDRLTGELCDAVTGSTGGRAMLEGLERANLFLVPLDDRRQWYRYHHLFADVLRAHLEADRPEEIPRLHRRAADWFDAAGEPVPAVRHALAAGDLDRAAGLVEAAVPALGRDRAEATLRAWVDEFPDEVVRRRPLLALGLVGGLMQHNDFVEAEGMLVWVQRWLPAIREASDCCPRTDLPESAPGPVGGAPLRRPRRFAEAALARPSDRAHVPRGTGAGARRPGRDHPARRAGGGRGAARRRPGPRCCRRPVGTGAVGRWRPRCCRTVVLAVCARRHPRRAPVRRARLHVTWPTCGWLRERLGAAQQAYDEGLALASSSDPALRGAADMRTGLAETALERGDVATARRELLAVQERGDGWGLVQNPYRTKAASAALAEAEGDLATARELLVEAEEVYLGDSPDVRPLHARIARIDVALGNLAAARRWAADRHVPAADLSYVREFEHVTYAEVLLAAHGRTATRGRCTTAATCWPGCSTMRRRVDARRP